LRAIEAPLGKINGDGATRSNCETFSAQNIFGMGPPASTNAHAGAAPERLSSGIVHVKT
jgi:hypothetical protein